MKNPVPYLKDYDKDTSNLFQRNKDEELGEKFKTMNATSFTHFFQNNMSKSNSLVIVRRKIVMKQKLLFFFQQVFSTVLTTIISYFDKMSFSLLDVSINYSPI